VAKKFLWNQEAIAQGADELEPEDVTCPNWDESQAATVWPLFAANAGRSKERQCHEP
jgi:hypothetical protein